VGEEEKGQRQLKEFFPQLGGKRRALEAPKEQKALVPAQKLNTIERYFQKLEPVPT